MASFTIADETHSPQGVAHTDLAEPKSRDFEALAQRDTGVKSGCAVTAQGTPDMTLAVASGVVRVAGVDHAVSAGNVTITANASGQPRYDAVVVNTSGTKSVIAGTAAAETTLDDPAIDLTAFCWLAKVYVAAGATAIGANDFVSKAIPMDVGVLDDTQIPAGIARDAEVSSAVSTHAGATDPHGDRAYADADVATHAAVVNAHATGAVAYPPIISPTALGAIAHNYNPTGFSTANTVRLSTTNTTQQNISGMAAPATDGTVKWVHNIGPGPIGFLDENAGSTAANRFALTGDMVLPVDSAVVLQYDSTSARWRAFPRATAATNPAITFGASNVGGTSPYFVRSDDQLVDPTIAHSAATDPHADRAFATSAIATHAGLADPHAGYVLESLIDAAGDLIVGTADNAVGRLAKGTGLQVLRTNSGATALEWATPAAGSVAADTIFDAKGDLPVGTGADTASKLAAGANDTMLMAASGASTGLKWATAAEIIAVLTGQVGGLPIISPVTSDFLFTVSNTTVQSITGLSFALGASATEIWLVEMWLNMHAANATMDAKFAWATVPSGAVVRWGPLNGTTAAAGWGASALGSSGSPLAMNSAATVIQVGIANDATTGTGLNFTALVFGGGTGGTMQLQGAQNVSDAGQLTCKKGSLLRATKIVA